MSQDRPGEWLELALPIQSGGDADDIAGLLIAALTDAASGVEVRAGEHAGAPCEIVVWVPLARGEVALEAARREATRLAATGLSVDPQGVVLRPALPEAEWRDAWKRYFRTTRLTRQIVVVPSWDRHDPEPADRVLLLDPGQAFGTGAHASTRLVLELMQELADAGGVPEQVLDLGTGSGILALAAAALWPAARILAIDDDPVAVAAAQSNLADNPDLAGRIRVSGAPIADEPGVHDLVLANIQADVLERLAPVLSARVAPGGRLVLSGLLAEQAGQVAGVYQAQPGGLILVEVRPWPADPAWAAALLRRPA